MTKNFFSREKMQAVYITDYVKNRQIWDLKVAQTQKRYDCLN